MDNLTHSMFGVALAEATFQIYRRKNKDQKAPLTRKSFYFTSIAANNFPDLDLLMNLVDPSTVGYLTHHRGHTHTVLWGLPQAAALAGLVFWRVGFSWYLLFLSFIGMLTHMALDFQNSYGVHLWSPFDNRWQYGDTLFIVEPLMWVPTFSLLAVTFQNRWLKIILAGLFLAIQLLGIKIGMASLASAGLCIAALILFVFAYKKLNPLRRPFVALMALLLIILVFKRHEVIAREKVASTYAQLNLAGVQDIVLSPLPSHPFCWTFFVVQSRLGKYLVDVGTLNTSSAPNLFQCPEWNRGERLRLDPSTLPPVPQITWLGQHSQALSELTEAYPTHCQLKGWYQFARVPAKRGDLYGDLRFGNVDRSNFSALDLSQTIDCPPVAVPWIPPRIDLLPTAKPAENSWIF